MKYSEYHSPTIRISEYDSITDFISNISKSPFNKFFQRDRCSEETTNEDWWGTSSYEEALKLLETGWETAAKEINKKLNLQLKAPATIQKLIPTYGLVGGSPSVPRYLMGLPDAMLNKKKVLTTARVITLTKDISYNAEWSYNEIQAEGIKVLRVIHALAIQNIRCKLNVYLGTYANGEILVCKICVKRPEDRINVIKCAFPMCHTAMLRRLLLRWIEVHPTAQTNFYRANYGRPRYESKAFNKNEYYLPIRINDIEAYVRKIL